MALTTALTGNLGDLLVLKSTTVDTNGLSSTSSVVWTSSNTTVATTQNLADRPGWAMVYCLTAGTSTITATAGSTTATFTLTVQNLTAGAATTVVVETDQSIQTTRKMQ